MKGKLIVLEGIDGSGKSTLAERLARRMGEAGLLPLVTREPTDGPIGKEIRSLAREGRLDPVTEGRLFREDRREHVKEVIGPALDSGQIVLCDRYYLSTMAYQGVAGLDPYEVQRENEAFAPVPDLTLLLDIPIEVSIDRLGLRERDLDAFEVEHELEFARRLYVRLACELEYVEIVNADQEEDKLELECWKLIEPLLQDLPN